MRFNIVTISILAVILSGCANNNTKPSSSVTEVDSKTATTEANVQKVKGLHDVEGEIAGVPNVL